MRPAPAPSPAASMPARPRPEVLAPAGDFDCVRAAVENGADAVYFGVSKFNARARARNFAVEELPELLSMLRLRGVKAYVTFNTLIFSNELEEAEKLLEKIVAAGPDAMLLQDLGVMRLLRELAPGFPIHASTQTTTTCPEQMGLLRELGVERVVLARELSIAEIRRIKAATDMPLEVFAHGALCVAYSGQCLTSEALGGRSANRGACAQACRLPYTLIVDGAPRDLGERKYLISPQDLDAHALVPELLDLVASLKIEGRLKTPEYVAATVRAYRKAVDLAAEAAFSRDEELALQQVFSRGLSPGFLSGLNHQALVKGLSPKKRGVFLGTVVSVEGDRVAIALQAPLKPGDGIVFDYGKPQDDEPGGRVTHVWREGVRVESADAPDAVAFAVHDCPLPQPGWRVWKTSDPALYRELRATFEKTGARVAVDAVAEALDGNLKVTFSDGARAVSAEAGPLQEARNRPLTAEVLREQLGRLGSTPFELRSLEVRLGNVMLPVSRLNDLRRRLAEELEKARRGNPAYELRPGALGRLRAAPSRTAPPLQLVALARGLAQLEAALAEGVREVECDFEDVRRYADAVALARAAGAAIFVAPPRIHKPGEDGILKSVLKAGADGVLVRSTAHFEAFAGVRRIGDYSLNAANELTAELLLGRGLERIVPSYDLNWEQLQALIARVDPGKLEVTAHQHMPMFHMEHCVFAAELSKGKDSTDCGRPCDRHVLRLKDWSGMEHPLKADVGCRNTIYNAVPQSTSAYVRRMAELGVRRFRVELLAEKSDETRRLLRGYRDVVEGRSDGQSLWRELRATSVLGVTRGPLGRDD